MGSAAETPEIVSGSLLRLGDSSTFHFSSTHIAIHAFQFSAFRAHSAALVRPFRLASNIGIIASSRAHMADLEACHRSTVVESVSCNVTGLGSFYSPHGTAEGNTPRERQYDRNAEQTQGRSQEFLQYPSDQSREVVHEGFVDSHQPYSEPVMENVGVPSKRELAQGDATLASAVAEVQQEEGEGSSCWHRSKTVSGARSEVLRNSSVPPEYHRRASLNGAAPSLVTKTYERVSPSRLISMHHPSRELQIRSEASEQRSSRVLQQQLLQKEEAPLSKPPISSAQSVSRCLHSHREWASEGHSWPHQAHASEPVIRLSADTNRAELTAVHGVRMRPSSPCKGNEHSATAKDLVINALCDQIQHQQWKLTIQESRLHNQEQRLHELEAIVSSFQAQQDWKQRQQQQHMCHLLSRSRGCHGFSSVDVINELASSSSGIPRIASAANPSLIGSQWPAGIVDSSSTPAERQGVCSAPADHQWLRSNIDQTRGDIGSESCREGTRKKSAFCCF